MNRRRLLEVALGRTQADHAILGGRVVNVHTGEIYEADVAVAGSEIALVGDASECVGPDTKVLRARDRYVVPGLIDAHLHTYETHLSVGHLAVPMLEHGVTTIATDFYGEAVVEGKQAIRASLTAAERSLLNVLWTLPMPAYYQDRPFVHSGSLDDGDMRQMLAWPECVGINECFAPYVVAGDSFLLDLMDEARARGKALCGHASEIRGRQAMAWAAFGGYLDDHECVAVDEVIEKARMGVRIVLREGSGVTDVRNCLPAITEAGLDARRFSFCSDLLSPLDLVREGNIDRCVRYACEAGVPAIDAVRMGSLNAAETLGVDRRLGSVAPGKRADICLVGGRLEDFEVEAVIAGGRLVVEGGAYTGPEVRAIYPEEARSSVRLSHTPATEDFVVRSERRGTTTIRAIEVTDGSLISKEVLVDLPVVDGVIAPAPEKDTCKVASFERHGRSGDIGVGFVKGFGLRRGAVASTYNPHCQHLLVLGAEDNEMVAAARAVADMGGGFCVVAGGQVRAAVPLPIYGLLSDQRAEVVVGEIEGAVKVLRNLGCRLSAPWHTLAFLGLPVIIGELKICSKGLIDVWKGEVVALEVDR
jgi:adenine deaminase